MVIVYNVVWIEAIKQCVSMTISFLTLLVIFEHASQDILVDVGIFSEEEVVCLVNIEKLLRLVGFMVEL